MNDYYKPIRIAEAAKLFGLTVSALRTEAKRGNLTISRIAGKDWTCKAALTRMFEKCQVAPKEFISGSEQPVETNQEGSSEKPAGSLKIEDARLALESALRAAWRLKESSRPTYKKFISPSGGNVVSMKSKLRT